MTEKDALYYIRSLRRNNDEKIKFTSIEGYAHTIQFGPFFTKRRHWMINGDWQPYSTVLWQLTKNCQDVTCYILIP